MYSPNEQIYQEVVVKWSKKVKIFRQKLTILKVSNNTPHFSQTNINTTWSDAETHTLFENWIKKKGEI